MIFLADSDRVGNFDGREALEMRNDELRDLRKEDKVSCKDLQVP